MAESFERPGANWLPAERKTARAIFALAESRQSDWLRAELQRRLERARTLPEAFDLERFLARKRREVDQLFDFRYSVLCQTFAGLVAAGLLSLDDLAPLTDEKRAVIQEWLRFYTRE